MKELKTGLVVFLALLVFVVTIFTLGNFKDHIRYTIAFPRVVGLSEDAPIYLNGVKVGRVSKISFPEDIQDESIYVEVLVERNVGKRINSTTQAEIQTLGVLGDKYISLETLDYSKPQLNQEEFIKVKPTIDYDGLIQKSQGILDNVAELTLAMKNLAQDVKQGEGLLGILLKDPEIGRSFLQSINLVTRNLEEGKGILGKLINDKEFCSKISYDFEHLINSLNSFLTAVNSGDGLLGELVHNESFKNEIKDRFIHSSESMELLLRRLSDSSNGSMFWTMMTDEQAADDMKESLKYMSSILKKIDEGEGTLGLLVNDSSLYYNADTLMQGVKEGAISRAIIKHYRKKGINSLEKTNSEDANLQENSSSENN